LPADDSIQIAARKPSRAECGLPDEGYVFCSFNHDYKINPPMWSVWMDLLREHPKSVLWLMKLNDDAIGNLQAAADRYEVDPKRLVFATRVPAIEDHLARYLQADLFLDTTPYNAHSTATDVLRTGLPILTLSGQTFASRVARSVIQSTNPELGLLATDLNDYGRLARQQMGRARPSPSASHYPSALQQAEALEELYAQIARETAQGGTDVQTPGGVSGRTPGGVQGMQAV
jgi:predicted O-linked N-acetylglucosamine transferase (SPINDLY family)